jgi:hypothetical protein
MLELLPFYCEETREKCYTFFFIINLFKIGKDQRNLQKYIHAWIIIGMFCWTADGSL